MISLDLAFNERWWRSKQHQPINQSVTSDRQVQGARLIEDLHEGESVPVVAATIYDDSREKKLGVYTCRSQSVYPAS